MADNGYTFDQLAAQPQRKPASKGYTFDELTPKPAAAAPQAPTDYSNPVDSAIDYIAAKAYKAVHTQTDYDVRAGKPGHFDLGKTEKSFARATVEGMTSLADLAAQGIAGIVRAAKERNPDSFEKGAQSIAGKYPQILERSVTPLGVAYKIAQHITGANLAEPDFQDKAMADLLNVIPEGNHAVGETVYDKTGWAWAGAGSEALLTGLMLKSDIAEKVFGKIWKDQKVTAPKTIVETAFDELAVKNPEGAAALADHVAESNPKAGETMHAKAAAAQQAEEPIIGADAAKARLKVRLVGKDERTGKPRMRVVLPEELATGVREAMRDGYEALKMPEPKPPSKTTADPFAGLEESTVNAREHSTPLAGKSAPGFELQDKLRPLQKKLEMLQARLSGINAMDPKNPARKLKLAGVQQFIKDTESEIEKVKAAQNKPVTSKLEEKLRLPQKRLDKLLERQKNIQAMDAKNPTRKNKLLQIEQDVKNAQAQIEKIKADHKGPEGPSDIVYFNSGIPITKEHIAKAFDFTLKAMDKIPGYGLIEGKLSTYWDQILSNVAPEVRSENARLGGTFIAKRIIELPQKEMMYTGRSSVRKSFWEKNPQAALDFFRKHEKGEKFSDPLMQKVSDNMRAWATQLAMDDRAAGIKYDEESNYIAHIVDDPKRAANVLDKLYHTDWSDPWFTKDKIFKTVDQLIASGAKMKTMNPEEIMQIRSHASEVARMQISILDDLANFNLAKKMEKPSDQAPAWMNEPVRRRAPNGNWYWIDGKVHRVIANAFDSKSLWQARGMGGDLYRSIMFMKNSLIPLKLGFSAFHFLHELTIHNATGMVRLSKLALTGHMNPVEYALRMGSAFTTDLLYKGLYADAKIGNRFRKILHGDIPKTGLKDSDKAALQAMADGGFIPGMPDVYKTNSIENFKAAVERRSPTAIVHAPFAAIQLLAKPMFEIWIPNLKTASYLHDVATAMKTDPSLLMDPAKRQLAFRKIAKSIDNRYGEMQYNTLFWNKWIKDIGVGTTLSLGWNLGFLREYGGGMLDIVKGGKVAEGAYDRPMFVMFYTAQAMLWGGLITWGMTGKPPSEWMDYFNPRTGEVDQDGKPIRMTTMFYTREFASLYKHMQTSGAIEGVSDLVMGKGSGMVGLVKEFATGKNEYGDYMRNPDDPVFKQIQEQLQNALPDLLPISYGAYKHSQLENKTKAMVLSGLGFSQAPQYMNQTPLEANVVHQYDEFASAKAKPYEVVMKSQDMKELRKLFKAGDPKYDDLLDKITETYKLTPKDVSELQKQLAREGDKKFDLNAWMFSKLPKPNQDHLWSKMRDEDRERYESQLSRKRKRELKQQSDEATTP